MQCQRARILSAPSVHRAMEGKELWVQVGTPERISSVYSFTRNAAVEYPSAYLTPYHSNDGESWFVLEAHQIEWLARGPEDFADVQPGPLAAWLTENGLDLRFE